MAITNKQIVILKAVPYTTYQDLDTQTSTNSAADWAVINTTNCDWIEFVTACVTNDVTMTITPASGATTTQAMVAAHAAYTNKVIVNNAATTTVQIQSTSGGSAGDASGYFIIHGMFKI